MSVTCLVSGPLHSAVLEKQHLLHGSWALGPGEAVRQPETILAFTPHVGQPGPSVSERPLGLFFFKNVLALGGSFPLRTSRRLFLVEKLHFIA